MTPHLCLGTAQFGLAYGITNTQGQVTEQAVSQLLVQAKNKGIKLIDTAQAYGEAESVLGRQLPTSHNFKLISKLPKQHQQEFNAHDVDEWQLAYLKSCKRLRVKHLDSLLLHAPADLKKPGGHHLEEWLLNLRSQGLVKRIGTSIYAEEELEGVNPELLDLVQLPLSLFDQRLLQSGTVAKLRQQGTAVHARSLFLQGLLLTPADQWPDWINASVKTHQRNLEALGEKRGCLLLDLALAFAKEQKDLEAVVVGVCNVEELIQIQTSWSSSFCWQNNEWRNWSLQNPKMLDPRCWPN